MSLILNENNGGESKFKAFRSITKYMNNTNDNERMQIYK